MFFLKLRSFKVSYPYPLGYPIKAVIKNFNTRALIGWLFQKYGASIKPEEILVSERIVELPLLHQWLSRVPLDSKSKILEVGHVASSVLLELASLGYNVTGIDLRPYPFTHKNLKSLVGDFLLHDFCDEKFDFIYSLSVIEHFGFTQRYDGEKNVDNRLDEQAFSKMFKLLKASGRVVISVPYSRQVSSGDWFRVYTRDDLERKLGEHFQILEQQFYARGKGQWNKVLDISGDPDSARDGVALFLLSPKS
ncbi:MAG TPA: methyltransferase domain-containing protein [Candidatus Paceibacterota bacterium]|nr:methyltransferase domain-containing protein [Candidatus Paceibacterota bacterium]